MNDKKFLEKTLRVATFAAKTSGEILLSKYKKINYVKDKKEDIQDFVTEADIKSEENIRELISKNFPKHSFLGEECGLIDQKSEYLWVVDPLCGTANFVNQIDLFDVSICLIWKNEPILTVVYDPIKNSLYHAISKQGAYFNDRKVNVSDVEKISQATIAFTLGKTKSKRKKWLPCIGKLIMSCYKLREYGSTPLSIGFLITGRIDAYLSLPYLWDAAAGVLLTREAGGKVTDWQGNEWNLDSSSLLVSNGKIHKQLLKILNK
ncbi:inositol monophosphatase [Candidatus Microgenomates bacterium]|nr:inositol monophosphatase [Candidatus Microgenomates bacterium]